MRAPRGHRSHLVGWLRSAAPAATLTGLLIQCVAATDAISQRLPGPAATAEATGIAGVADPFDAAPFLQAERLRGLRPEVVRAILGDDAGGEIAVAVLACAVPAAGGGRRTALFLEIDGASFLDSNQASIAPVEVYAYALSPRGAVAGYLAEAFTLDVAADGEAVWNGGLRYIGWLELPPGQYELRIMVRNTRSLARGLTSTRLVVPAEAEGPALLPPLVAGPRVREPWLPVRGRAGWASSGGGYPLLIGERPLLPAARPVLVANRPATVHLFADRLPAGPVAGSLSPPSADGADATRPVVSVPLEVTARTIRPGGLSSLEARFPTPAIAPGGYALRLELETPGGALTTPPLGVLVIDAGPQDRELLWSDLKAIARGDRTATVTTGGVGQIETAAPQRVRPRRGSRRLAGRYREALARSLAGERTRPSEVLDFEIEILGRGGEQPLEWLRAAELETATRLGQQRAALILPLISLHDDLFHLYRRRHLFSLVTHTRRLLESLTELYAELGGEPAVAAGALASVGGYMQELRAPGESRRLFGRALLLDPESPAALLGMASSFEKYGEYAQAVERLEQLCAAHPGLREARLRLALNLERVGERQRFRELLGGLAGGDGDGWVEAVASQELARSHLEAGAAEQAESVLVSALARMPERQALWILLAHVHDRMGMLSRSWESLERVAAQPAADRRSERLTYDDWANSPLASARRGLRLQAEGLRGDVLAELGGEPRP